MKAEVLPRTPIGRLTWGPFWLLMTVVSLVLAPVPAKIALAQDSGGTITTQPLEPLPPGEQPEGDSATDSRFKPAPFRTQEIPQQPILIDPVETETKAGARMRQLDKMTGRTETFELAAGTEKMVERLRIRLEACRAPADNAQHGTMAYVDIWDSKRPDDPPVFSGWMFAESPALSALDHPRYDVWVISCTM